jgi:hypothetical protein
MVSRSVRIKILLVTLAILVLLMPFLLPPTCQIGKGQLHTSVTSPRWIVGPEGGILTIKITIENNAGCDANVETLQFTIYRLIYGNTTEDVDLNDAQVIHTTIPAGGNATVNFAFEQPFSEGPRAVLVRITIILQDSSSLEVFDGAIDTTVRQESS